LIWVKNTPILETLKKDAIAENKEQREKRFTIYVSRKVTQVLLIPYLFTLSGDGFAQYNIVP